MALGCKGTSQAEGQQQAGSVTVRTGAMWDTKHLTRALAGTALLGCGLFVLLCSLCLKKLI